MIIGVASADYLNANKSPDGEGKWGGSGWARVGQYLPYLEHAGHKVVIGILWDMADGYMSIKCDATEEVFHPDVIIMQRMMLPGLADLSRRARSKGQIVVNDIDDWYWGLDPRNEAWKASHPKYSPKENIKFYAENVLACDYIISSTPWLQDVLTKKFKVPTVLIENTVDVSRFTPVSQHDVPTFGWVGSAAHRSGDVEQIKGVFNQFLRDDSLQLHHSGDNPRATSFADMLGLPREQVSTLPMVPSADYPSLMVMDVGLVPLNDIPFNHAKSDIKGIEYAAAGIPFIASSLPSYKTLHDRWGTGMLLARRRRDWISSIKRLLDRGMREEYSAALLELVQERDISVGATQVVEFYESLV